MSESILRCLESFIRRGEYIQSQLSTIKTPKSVRDDARRDLVGEVANIFVRDVLELPFGGKAKKYSKAFMREQEREQIKNAEMIVERNYVLWTQNIEGYLSLVSVVKKGLTPSGNSYELVSRIKRVQDAKRLETKIRGTISALRAISLKNLILNKDIPEYIEKTKPKKEKPKEIIIPPEKPFTGQRALAEMIESTEGYLLVMDTYVDEKTLDLLHYAPESIPIKLLTCFTGGADNKRRFLRACKNLKVEHPGFEIRKCQSNLFHDRFILTRNKGWMIGASLKDAGKKLTMITEMSPEILKQMRGHFEEIWKKSVSC